MTPIQARFEKWAFMAGLDIQKQGDQYQDPHTAAAFQGFSAAMDICRTICADNARYYVAGSGAAQAASRCAADIEYAASDCWD